ncbi:MAG: FecR domain-containing protein [Bacteroidales bacterium]|nr:FecR domain-containing protein [Bacteroidales bacterium]MDD2425923.1 FecR domain-containing protein [Bacteroidales bacterium]MDD3990337.1 FecR domain-containing protein [Bacteroidales bacterium]
MEKDLYNRIRMVIMSRKADETRGWEETQNKIYQLRKKRKVRFWSAAASVAAVAIISLFVFYPNQKDITSLHAVNADPGKNQAVLIMSDGSSVSLTDSSDTKLVDASGAEISVEKGKNISYGNSLTKSEKISINTIVVPRSGFYSVTLSDETKVWINSESRFSYPVRFNGDKREVTLSGEAYFEVAKDNKHPFVVNCNGNKVVVTGTRFNLNSYDQDRTVTTLIEGSVIFSGLSGSMPMTPGMQATISTEGISVKMVEPAPFASWKDGFFEFNDLSLGEIVKILSRWYDVDFEFSNPQIAGVTFTATFPKDENLSFIITLLERISSARFAPSGDKVVVSSNQ